MKQISVPDAVPGRDGPAPAYRTKRRQARRSVHEQKRGSMNLLERTPHARTHARDPSTHSCAPALRLCPRVSPFFFIFIAERDTDGVVEEISALAKRRRV